MSSEIYFLIGFVVGSFVTYTILNIQLREYKALLNRIIKILETQTKDIE